MALLTFSNVSKYYGAEEIFAQLTAEIHSGECVAFVGRNGCGKSTLLEILTGHLEPDSGNIHLARYTQLGYLPQMPDFAEEGTLWDAMIAVFADLQQQAQHLRDLEQRMASGAETEREAAMTRYGTQLEAFETAGGFTYEAEIGRVLGGLGFTKEEFATPVAYLSGGERTRALLARLLLEKPDLLLLDEPTNHLDLEGIEWLEDYLKVWKGAIIVVAHDRAFLDALASHVWELENRQLETYRGNYTAYLQQRETRRAQQRAAYETQQAHIAKTEDYIHRYMAGQRSSQAQGRLKRLEREERLARPTEPVANLHLNLQTTIRSGDLVLRLYDLQAGYTSNTPLVTAEELEIHRSNRIALVGPNGSGKTTLLRTILREITPLSGHIRHGSAVRIGYFAQIQQHLLPQKTVLDTLLDAGMVSIGETRSFLARYGFRGDTVFKKVGVLSGGERTRVALAILALQQANFLILDEPTNHLDLVSQETLQQVLQDFAGTILMVSHDRYLIREIATHVWALADGTLHPFKGYAAYAAWRQAQREGTPATQHAASAAKQQRETERRRERERQRALTHQQRRLEELETTIHAHEEQLQTLTVALENAGRAQDVPRVTRLGAQYHQLEAEMNRLLEEWTVVADNPVEV